ncbi:hypothetical protein PENSPDRAFT_671968 [Peniophora sp. CONT]|nr:hypothetical protein PENSPDRAFT_671968 [Peniophora sp. CONT]
MPSANSNTATPTHSMFNFETTDQLMAQLGLAGRGVNGGGSGAQSGVNGDGSGAPVGMDLDLPADWTTFFPQHNANDGSAGFGGSQAATGGGFNDGHTNPSGHDVLQAYGAYSGVMDTETVTVPKTLLHNLYQLVKDNTNRLDSLTDEVVAARTYAANAAAEAASALTEATTAKAQADGLEERVLELVAAPTASRRSRNGNARTPRNTSAESVVHRAWYTVLGLPYMSKNQKDVRLPDPRVDGTVQPLTEDGPWSANWALGPTMGHNPEVGEHVIRVLDQDKNAAWKALTEDGKVAAVNGYFITMAAKWRTYGDAERQAALERRQLMHTQSMRRKRWVDGLLKALPTLITYVTDKYGSEYVPGLAKILGQYEWYGLPCVGFGAANAADWDARKVQCGGGSAIAAWEVRDYAWKSVKVGAIFGVIERATILPIFQLVRLQALLIKKAREMPSDGKQAASTFQFPGLKVNLIQDAPSGVLPHRDCVAPAWIEATQSLLAFPEVNEEVACLRLDLPDTEFENSVDRIWLGEV